jgi:glycerophosphoryl diester phosphodiesterase
MAPLLLGHRGARASRHIPENTLASFELGLQHGCDGFEFDVRCSADECAVICHDPAIRGLEIRNTGGRVLALPSLAQVLQQFSSRAFLDIELKVAGLEKHLVSALGEHPPQKGYVVSSFLPEALMAVYVADAAIPLGFLWDEAHALPPIGLPVAWLIPRIDFVNRGLVEDAHAEGKRLMTWTVNRAEEMRELAEWDVDAIISDDTDLLVRTFRTL